MLDGPDFYVLEGRMTTVVDSEGRTQKLKWQADAQTLRHRSFPHLLQVSLYCGSFIRYYMDGTGQEV